MRPKSARRASVSARQWLRAPLASAKTRSAAIVALAFTAACSREGGETSSRPFEPRDSSSIRSRQLSSGERENAASISADAESPLTPNMRAALRALAPDFIPWTRDQFSADTRERDSSNSRYGLSIVRLDFNADGQPDAAVLGRGKDKYYFVAIFSSGAAGYRAVWLEPPGDLAATDTIRRRDYLLKEPRGLVEIPDVFGGPAKRLRLTGDGVSLLFGEEAGMLYYWEGGIFKKVLSGD